MLYNLFKNKSFQISVLLVIFSIAGLMIYERGKDKANELSLPKPVSKIEPAATNNITVHIEGAVKNPGVYIISPDMHTYELVLLAGGILPEASLKKVNLAKILIDGDKIMIAAEKQKNSKSAAKVAAVREKLNMVNINYANKEQLMSLPGVGEKTASDIIALRQKNGIFKEINDLLVIKGMGKSKLEKIKKYLYL
ncbi:MAG: ComEA family DNA-binding protein [Candidatus Margulisbacteria bacterium]|nr:ComEA family DNA-binding protein [Candidatus Margulisiibacteriota bacterium]